MSEDWKSERMAPVPRGWRDVIRGLLRVILMGFFVFGGLLVLLLVRLVERPVFGTHRPWTPFITVFACRMALLILGLSVRQTGDVMSKPGAIVANHGTWLDIFVLNARKRIYFVSKAEVANWPMIGWLARATGTVFIERKKAQAKKHIEVLRERIEVGHKLLFFPEGVSTDSLRIAPFKPTLFQPFVELAESRDIYLQAVSVRYHAPEGADPRFYGWWGDMGFGESFWMMLCIRRQGRVELVYHEPVNVKDFPDRKALAAELERQVKAGAPDLLECGPVEPGQ